MAISGSEIPLIVEILSQSFFSELITTAKYYFCDEFVNVLSLMMFSLLKLYLSFEPTEESR